MTSAKNKLANQLAYLLVVGASLFVLFFVITCTWIGYSVKSKCIEAKADYNGTCVQSLLSLLQDDTQSFKSRNGAIWALGQLGDSSALPVLKTFYTGNIPDREPINGTISQYELKKAIYLLNGGTNLTTIFWRYNIN